jgi:hypothetical protein
LHIAACSMVCHMSHGVRTSELTTIFVENFVTRHIGRTYDRKSTVCAATTGTSSSICSNTFRSFARYEASQTQLTHFAPLLRLHISRRWPSARPDAVVPGKSFDDIARSVKPDDLPKELTVRKPWERGIHQNYTDT